MSKFQKFIARNIRDGFLLLLFGGAAVALFIIEINIVDATSREETLFRALEFFIALILGWFLQRIASREEFLRSLRDYAISAYRRISDIQKSVERFRLEVVHMRRTYPADKIHELDVLAVLGDEMKNTVLSSSYDWADIIGDELEKIEQFQKIETELRTVSSLGPPGENSETFQTFLELKKELARLRSDIPILMQSSFPGQLDVRPREERISSIVVDHFLSMIQSQSSITLLARYFGDLTEEAVRRIQASAPYMLMEDRAMMQIHLGLHDSNGEMLGEIINPFESSDIYKNDFAYTLMDLLSQAFGYEDRGPGIIRLKDSEFVGVSTLQGQFSIKVPLTISMIAKG